MYRILIFYSLKLLPIPIQNEIYCSDNFEFIQSKEGFLIFIEGFYVVSKVTN